MTIHFTLELEPRTDRLVSGLWCPHCLLPSGYQLPCDRISEQGVTPAFIVIEKCHDCDRPLMVTQ